ncbi:hypothetical protein ABIC35_003042 [Sphingomonas trueperi]
MRLSAGIIQFGSILQKTNDWLICLAGRVSPVSVNFLFATLRDTNS